MVQTRIVPRKLTFFVWLNHDDSERLAATSARALCSARTNDHQQPQSWGTRLLAVVLPGEARGFDTGSGAGGVGFRWRVSRAKIIVRVHAAIGVNYR
jgi:hypothetical protein